MASCVLLNCSIIRFALAISCWNLSAPVPVNTLSMDGCHCACAGASGTAGAGVCPMAPFRPSNAMVAWFMASLAPSMDDMSMSMLKACCMSYMEDIARLTAPMTS